MLVQLDLDLPERVLVGPGENAGIIDIIGDSSISNDALSNNQLTVDATLTLNGTTGEVYSGALNLVTPELTKDYETLMSWSDEIRAIKAVLGDRETFTVDQGATITDAARLMAVNRDTDIKEVGIFMPKPTAVKELLTGPPIGAAQREAEQRKREQQPAQRQVVAKRDGA